MATRLKPRSDAAAHTIDHAPPANPPASSPALAPASGPAPAPTQLADYRPVRHARARHDGWTADRQRTFLTVLAETGSISDACSHAGVSSRSAYRLRQRPDAGSFATAWDQALRLATLRLTAIAFERAVKGTVREIWRDDTLVAKSRQPSDKLLMFLLSQLLPRQGAESRLDAFDTTVAAVRTGFPATLAALADHDVAMVPVETRDFFPAAPGDSDEDC